MKIFYKDTSGLINDLTTELGALTLAEKEESEWSLTCPEFTQGSQEHVLQELLKCCKRDIEYAEGANAQRWYFNVEEIYNTTGVIGWNIIFVFTLAHNVAVQHFLVRRNEDDFLLRYHRGAKTARKKN